LRIILKIKDLSAREECSDKKSENGEKNESGGQQKNDPKNALPIRNFLTLLEE